MRPDSYDRGWSHDDVMMPRSGHYGLRAVPILSPVPEINFAATHRGEYNRRLDRLSADLDAKGYRSAPARHRSFV